MPRRCQKLFVMPTNISYMSKLSCGKSWSKSWWNNVSNNLFWQCSFVHVFTTLRPRQNGLHVADDIFKCIFLNENVRIPITISLKFVPKGQINNIPALVKIMAWRRPGDKPLSEPMIVSLPTHICVTRPQWVKGIFAESMPGRICYVYEL